MTDKNSIYKISKKFQIIKKNISDVVDKANLLKKKYNSKELKDA